MKCLESSQKAHSIDRVLSPVNIDDLLLIFFNCPCKLFIASQTFSIFTSSIFVITDVDSRLSISNSSFKVDLVRRKLVCRITFFNEYDTLELRSSSFTSRRSCNRFLRASIIALMNKRDTSFALRTSTPLRYLTRRRNSRLYSVKSSRLLTPFAFH